MKNKKKQKNKEIQLKGEAGIEVQSTTHTGRERDRQTDRQSDMDRDMEKGSERQRERRSIT